MNLTSLPTLLAILAAYLVYRFLVPAGFRAAFLLIVSALFILFQSAPIFPVNIAYILFTLLILLAAHFAARRMAGKPPEETADSFKWNVAVILLPLLIFKIISLIAAPIVRYAQIAIPGFEAQFLAPLGISYLTFRVLAYVIEVRRGNLAPVRFRDLFLYATFWPTLLSGPIERPDPFLTQMRANPAGSREDLAAGLARIAAGAVKAFVLGDLFGRMAKPFMVLGSETGLLQFMSISVGGLWICLISYYFHLYLNFAGYSDIAIGLARVFGYRIRENFDWPFLAPNISEFWRRWHISLTGLITEYVYFPLGGSRKGTRRAWLNTYIAMLLVGAWHGLNFHFLWWGAYHATLLSLYRMWRKSWRKRYNIPDNRFTRFASVALTFIAVALGWVLFLLPFDAAFNVYLKLFGIAFTDFNPSVLME